MVKQHSSFWRTAFARSKSLEFFPGRISFISMMSTEGKVTAAGQKPDVTPSEAAATCLHPRHPAQLFTAQGEDKLDQPQALPVHSCVCK